MNSLKVENEPNLIRDLNSTAILNTNIDALNKHRELRNRIKLKEEDKDNQIQDLSNRLLKLESLLSTLINTNIKN